MANTGGKINNPKTEVASSQKMNDKDYLADVLATEKDILKNYCVALTEASNNDLHSIINGFFNEINKLQREVYNLMFEKGWYVLEKAPTTKITEKITMLNEDAKQLGN